MRRRRVAIGLAILASAVGSGLPRQGTAAVVVAPTALARYQGAHALLQAGEYGPALAAFEALPANFILDDYAEFFALETLLRQGRDEAALVRLRAFPERHPDSVLIPAALLAAHDTAFRLGRFRESIDDARRLLARVPTHAEAGRVLVRLAEAEAALGQTADALAELRRRVTEAPASAWGEVARDLLEEISGRQGLPVAPFTPEERLLLAQRLIDASEVTAGSRVLLELLGETQDPELRARALVKLAPALGRVRRSAEGIDHLRAGLDAAPLAWRAALLAELARLHGRSGQPALAADTLERLLAEHPSPALAAEAWLSLARLRQDLGQPAASRQAYERLLDVPGESGAAASGRWELAWLDYRDGRLRDAALGFRQLAATPGYRLAGLYWAARALEGAGESGLAAALYRETVSRGPNAYYGVQAVRRLRGRPPPPSAPALRLGTDPLAALAPEAHYRKALALWSAGFEGHALTELEFLGRDASTESERAWGLAVAYAQLGDVARSLRMLRRGFGAAAEGGAPGIPRRFWSLYFPLGHEQLVRDAARRAGIEPLLVSAVIREESSWDSRARSWVGAVGLMQLMPDTARDVASDLQIPLGDPGTLWEPPVNVALGAHYLARLRARFSEPLLAVASYNAGPARVQRWLESRPLGDLDEWVDQIPFEETRGFVKRVATSWYHYRRLYGAPEAPARPIAPPPARPPARWKAR